MDEFKDIPIGCVLADEVDVISVIEETVDLCDVGVVQEVIDLDLAKDVFNNVQLDHLPFLQHFDGAEESGFLVDCPKYFTVGSFSKFTNDPKLTDMHSVGLYPLCYWFRFARALTLLDLPMIESYLGNF